MFLARYFHKRGLRGEDVQDAVSGAFLGCVEAVRRGTLIRDPDRFVTGVARRVWARFRRKRRQDSSIVCGFSDAEPAASMPDDEVDPAPEGIEVEDLVKAIQLLPPCQREVIHARYFLALKGEQAAEELDMKPGNVRQRHTEAIRTLALLVPLQAKARARRLAEE